MAKLIGIVVTNDLEDLVVKSYQAVPSNLLGVLGSMADEFIGLLSEDILRDFSVHKVQSRSLSNEMRKMRKAYDEPFVSLDEMHIGWADCYYLITTLFRDSHPIKWTSKLGSGNLDEQILAIKGHRTVLLGDIGAQSGRTAVEVMRRFELAGINVSRILLGAASSMAINQLSQFAPVQVVFPFERAYWMELRDMLGLDGRLIQSEDGVLEKKPTWEEFIRIGPFTENQRLQLTDACHTYKKLVSDALKSEGLCLTHLPIYKRLVFTHAGRKRAIPF